jgi:hypothetical protein
VIRDVRRSGHPSHCQNGRSGLNPCDTIFVYTVGTTVNQINGLVQVRILLPRPI